MESLQSKRPDLAKVDSIFPKSTKHLNAYLATTNLLYPSKVHPFKVGLMEKIRTCLVERGHVLASDLSREVSTLEINKVKLTGCFNQAYQESFPARIELGLDFDDSLETTVASFAGTIANLDFDMVLTLDYFRHLSEIIDKCLQQLGITLDSSRDEVPLEELVVVAIMDALLGNLIIQGSNLSFLHRTLFAGDGLDLRGQIRSRNRISLVSEDRGLGLREDGFLKVIPERITPALVELLQSFSRHSGNLNDSQAAAFFDGIVDVITAPLASVSMRAAETLHGLYMRHLSVELKLPLEAMNHGYLACSGLLHDVVDADTARQAIFDVDLLGLANAPKGRHLAFLAFLKSRYGEERLESAIHSISNSSFLKHFLTTY